MLFICVNATSASDTLETNLTSEDTADIQGVDAVDTSQEKLSSSGDTFVVDGNGGGDYTTISAAVSAATGGETIFIKNGNYTESQPISIGKSLSIVGESRDNVIISGGSQGVFTNPTDDSSLKLDIMLKDLTIKDVVITSGSNAPIKFYYADIALDIINCTFDNCGSKTGTMTIGTTTANIDGCKILNSQGTVGASGAASAIVFSNGGTYSMKNCEVNGASGLDKNNYAAIYFTATSGTLDIDYLTVVNCQGAHQSLIRGANGNKITIRNSVIANNSINRFNEYNQNALFFVGKNNAELDIEQSIIANNTFEDQFVRELGTSDSTIKINYCNIYDNSRYTHNQQSSNYDVEANWWGSNDKPADVTATTWIIEDNGEYALNNGSALDVIVPGLNEEPEDEPAVLPEGTIYVSATGNDANDGSSEATAVATISHAVKIAMNKTNKTSTIYILNGDYTTAPIDVTEANITFIGQEKGKVIIHGNGKYIFDVYGENLISKFENIDFVDSYSTGSMGALRLYADYSEFTVNNCNFRNISAKYGAIDLQADYGNINIANCVIEDVTGSTSMSAIVYINGESTSIFDNIEITNCRLDENYASENPTNYLRALFYVASKTATVTLTNSKISNNYGAMYGGVIESKSKLTVDNTVISDNIVNTSVNGANGGEYLIWASDDAADISIANCVITDNTIVKTTKGLLYNQKGKMSIEFCDVSNNNVEKFVGGTGTLTADNNWWGTNDQPDTKVNKWVVMNVALNDSDLSENNKITLTIDFNHVLTSSGDLEELTGGEIPKNSYSIDLSAKNGEINPTNVVVNKGQTVSKTFTVTEINDEITLACDGEDIETIIIEGIPPYRGIIYVNATGDDANEGSIDAPVATVAKAIELADKGSHEIIINEGTYVGNDYAITGNLTVTGNGKVTLDANNEGRLFNMAYGTVADKIELHNLILTNANGYGAAVYSFAKELILDNVTIVNNQASGYLVKSSGKLTVKDSKIINSTSGNVIEHSASGDILIKNTLFENNVVTDSSSVYGVLYISSGSGNLVVEDSQFINNTARQGVLIGNYNYNIDVKGSAFINNTNTVSSGGAIRTQGGTLTVSDSKFINNKAAKDGGAISVGYRTTAVVDKSVFVNNIANTMGDDYYGDAIYNGNKLTVNNCVLLTNAKNYIIYNDGEDNVVNAQNNWWGTNDNPENLVASGTYEDDDWEEQDCAEVDVSNWVTMDASFVPDDAQAGDGVTVVATFSNPNLPDGIRVTFTSTSGLNTVVSTVGGKASTTYTIDATDDAINATSRNAVIEMPIVGPALNVVTQDNFYSFFDNSGIILDTVEFDELVFKGNFSDLAAGYVIITKPITITGNNAVLNNMGIVVSSDDVTLNDLTFNADTSLGDLVYVENSNVKLNNLDITYTVGDESARALSLSGAKYVTVNNARITFESHVTDSANDGCAINIEESENVIVNGSLIYSSLPALYVDYMAATTQFMGLDKVNPIRVVGSNKVEITNNLINSQTNDYSQEYATIQAIAVLETKECLIDSNDIYLTDEFAQAGQDIYLYGISFAYDEGLVMSNNNFTVYTEGGKESAGTAYAIQGIESELSITGNNITTFSNGPNLGIYVTSMAGETSIMIIENNVINVTGLAAAGNNWALVSGIEIQNGEAKIYNNTIYTYNVDEYCEDDYLSGISYIQWMYGGRTFDIQDNFVYTEGKYAIYLLDASNSIITGNTLYGHELTGNDAVFIQSGDNNVIEDNVPKFTPIVTQDNFYSFFDEDGVLLDTVTVDELIFQGSFSNLAAGYVIITRPVTITGDNAVLNNMGFVIASEDVALDNLTLIATTSLGDLINVGASNVALTNLNITFITGDESANAINVQGTDTISNVNILNNNIYFENHATTDEELVTAINLNDVEDVLVDGNKITASMPSLYVGTYDYTYFMMGLCYVNPIRLWEASSTELTNNKVDVVVNSYDASYPTVQALYIVGSDDVLVKGNNFTMVDTLTPAGTAIYLYAVECGFSSGIEFIENNFNISTTGGKSGAGSAYALQVATSDATFIGNNITCDSNGPNLGIYSPMGFGPAKELLIKDNFINITGFANSATAYALISGIEIQTGYATIYNNTIYVQNKAGYGASYPVSGISAVQDSVKTLSFDIKDNTVYVNGKYAVDIRYAPQSAIVTGNFLVAYDLVGDKAVYFKSGNNNVVENNEPTNVVTNDTFYDFFDNDGILKTDLFKELVFNGTFSGLTDKIVFNMPIRVSGIDAVFNDIAINIASDNVKLNDLTLNSDKEFADNNGALIYATGANIEINNVVVNYTAPSEVEAIGIYANAANNFKLTNSEIIYVATNPGSKHNYGLEVRGSENVLIENNKIDATLPAVDVAYGSGEGIDIDLVLGIGIQGGKNINFTKNTVTVNTNGGVGSWPTIDAIQIHSAENVLVNLNTISHIDTTTSDTARYYNALDIFSSTATVDSNNILVNTTAGIERSGTAYPIQLTGPFTVIVSNNNLTSISKGPNAGIYASNWGGYGDLTIVGNNIDITGYAAEHNFALVSGIESQVDMTRIYGNVIKTHNIADYSDANQIYGISIAQYYSGDHAADIRSNNITTDGKYAVYYAHAINTNVTLNELLAHELEGDAAAFIASGDNNYININFPPYIPEIIIEANDTWIGNDVTVYVTIANTTGNVTIKVNDKEFKDLTLIDGKVSQIVDASDLIAGINNIVVTFTSTDDSMRSGNETGAFYVLNGVVTQDNYLSYFNQDDNGKLFDYVPEGATLDFQGSIINPDQANIVQMNINKPVNIVSTTGDAYVDLNTTAGSLLGESPGNSFAVTNGGSGSNVTGIYFHNTQIWISNTHDVVLDGISVVVEDQRIGSGVGVTTIRDNSSNVVLKNSYLYTRNNGGSTTFTMSWTTNCTIDNCTVRAEGNVGNLVYLNTANVVGAPSGVPLNNYNKIINNRIYGKEGSSISVGLMVEGSNNLIMNNTLYKSSISTSFGSKNPADNIYVGNTMTDGSGLTAQTKSIVYGNIVTGALSTGTGSVVYGNIVGGKLTVGQNAKAYNNTVGNGLTTGGTDAIIENNTIVGAVTINKLRTTITTTGNYAVDLGSKTGNNVTENYLIAKTLKGDDAVKFTNANNIVENNSPYKVSISVIADPVWIGSDCIVTVNVTSSNANASVTGAVTIQLNGKSYVVELENGVAVKEISAEDLVVGTNDMTVIFTSSNMYVDSGSENGAFYVLDGVVTQDTYTLYFNQDDNGKLFDYVPEGATLDFQGSIINPDQAITVQMNVNKPVNIVSTTGDAYVDLNTTAGSLLGESPGNSFAVTLGGSGSNVTGIYFHNTQIWISNTHDVVLDGISVVVEDQRVGSGVGATSIRDNSSNVVLKNSYLYTRNNGGSTTFTMSWTTNCTIDNCTVKAEGNVGNLVYLNTFNIVGAPSGVPLNNYNKIINNRIYGKEGSGISVGLMVEGTHNLIMNNTLYKSSISTSFGGSNPADNVYVGNTMTAGSGLTAQAKSIVYGNIVAGALSTGANSVVYNNTVGGKMTVGAGATAYDNTVGNGLTTGGTDAIIENNTIVGAVTINKLRTTNVIKENTIATTGNYAVDLGSKTGNNVTENELYAASLTGDDAVKGNANNNIIKYNYPNVRELVVNVEDIFVGETAKINVSLYYSATGTVRIIVDSRRYDVDIVDGQAILELSDLRAGDYDVKVIYNGDKYVSPSENITSFKVSKYKSDAIIATTPVVVMEDVNITVSIEGATGDVTVTVDGKRQVLPLTDGVAKLTIPKIKAGEHSIVVNYMGDSAHESVFNSTTFTVNRVATSIGVVSADINAGETANVVITLSEQFDVAVLVAIDGAQSYVILKDGTKTLAYPGLSVGTHTIAVKYEGDDYYGECDNFTEIVVSINDAGLKANASDINVGEDAVISIEIDNRVTGETNVFINEEIIPVTFIDGKAIVTIPNLVEGNYTALVKFEGDDEFAADEINVKFKVSKVVIDELDVTVDVPQGSNVPEFTVNLPDDATGTFTVSINGTDYPQEIVNGTATVKVPGLAQDTYQATVSYSGDDKYTAAQKTITVTLDKVTAGLKANTSDVKVGDDAVIDIEINETVTGAVNVYIGDEIIPVTLDNGKAKVAIPGLANGTYSAVVKFAGDDKFLADETTVTFTVSKRETEDLDVDVVIPEGTTVPEFTVSLPDDATGTFTVSINGTNYTQEVVDGSATIKVPALMPDDYVAVVSYSGDDKYAAVKKTIPVTVSKLSAGLKANASDIKVGENATVNIEINENAVGSVMAYLGNEAIPVTLDNGKATIIIPGLANGTYTVGVKFIGNELFADDELDVVFTVSKEELSNDTVNISSSIPEGTTAPEFTVSLPEDATGNFTVFVDGTPYTAEVLKGSATVKVPELTVGDHVISTKYSGDDKYDELISANETFDVPKASIPGGDNALDVVSPENSATPTYSIKLPEDAKGNLTVTVDGKDTYTKALVNGSASITLPELSSGKHTITVSYSGDDKYSGISKTVSSNVPKKAKIKTKITAKKKTFKANKKVKKYTITLKAGKKPVKKVQVTLKIKGKTYKAKTNAKGKATFKIKKLTKKGKYKAVIKFKGNKNYKASSKKVKITIK